MATLDDIAFQQEIGQPTFIELVTVNADFAEVIHTSQHENAFVTALAPSFQQAAAYAYRPNSTEIGYVGADDITYATPEECPISKPVIGLSWDGIPIRNVDFYLVFVTYTVRNPDNPLDSSRQSVYPVLVKSLAANHPEFQMRTAWETKPDPQALDYTRILTTWRRAEQLNDVSTGSFLAGVSRRDFVRASVADVSHTISDVLICELPDPPPGILESVEIKVAVGVRPTLFMTSQPTYLLSSFFEYTRNNKTLRFTRQISFTSLYEHATAARWERIAEFIIDLPDGSGLDQCTEPTTAELAARVSIGAGTCYFAHATLSGNGVCLAPNDPERHFVRPPPYEYAISNVVIDERTEEVACSCRFENRANFLRVQRDLFDPQQHSLVKHIATLKLTKLELYDVFLWRSSRLVEATLTTKLRSGMSVVMVDKRLNTIAGLRQITDYLRTSPQILPQRFTID